jgi:putative transposase
VHFILAPSDETGLGRAVGEAHRRDTNFINARGCWTGHLFQSRFSSVAMDESHLIAAARQSQSSAGAPGAQGGGLGVVERARSSDKGELVSVAPVLNPVDRFAALLESDADDGAFRALRSSEASGRPLGNADFIADLERLLGLSPDAPGRKSKRTRSGAVGSAKVKATENRYHVAVFPRNMSEEVTLQLLKSAASHARPRAKDDYSESILVLRPERAGASLRTA